ncbi:hypothetical protein Slin15195_G079300 [Septoria linicola]|uniref:F-box domain-containing protein n=1 Tax=Septoria linicola TaxID=215465 RepID=A0A9Q9B1G8_9PEZI|nr:hypothetical protein Slin14017_G040500 [Septoria linicola]USW54611.1 hypothetical protein Slin15195_G079300 [Septoria linicola]
MRYQRCKKVELIAFANDRGLQVSSSSTRGPSHRDYVAALTQADKDASLRFLDLPAELRNFIYEALLTLRDSFSCFPQILQTSKEVNREATTILYGENYIDVKIYPDGVFVHGQRCGQYQPALLRHNRQVTTSDSTTIPFPDYLGRAQFLRLIVPETPWVLLGARAPYGRDDSIGDVIYSLCQMPRQYNSLSVLRVVMRPNAISSFESIRTMLYPLHLLDGIGLDIVDSHDNSLANFYSAHRASECTTVSKWARLKAVYDCAVARSKLDQVTPGVFAPGMLVVACLDTATAAAHNLRRTSHSGDLSLQMSHASIRQVRISLKMRNSCRGGTPPPLLLEAYRLLRVEIDSTCDLIERSSDRVGSGDGA